MPDSPRCSIVPPYLLEALARSPGHAATAGRTLATDTLLRRRRQDVAERPGAPASATAGPKGAEASPARTIADAKGTEELPGETVRTEGGPATGDPAADEAYDGLGQTWTMLLDAFGRDSLDGSGLPLQATVHYGRDYDNAFWDGTQMVFGDGDGTIFNRFTISIDVIGHELAHGVTELTAGLTYQGQSGALNESISDVFGSLVKQHALGQSADRADWLIGAGLFTAQVKGVALRSMKAPGTAYDDPVLGRDPQPGHLDGYVETTDDHGGVHLNSGIPNHAFYLAATAIGGDAWKGAGQVWYDTLTGAGITPDCDFATFARLTLAAAGARFGVDSTQAAAITEAWRDVGIDPVAGPTPAEPPTPADPSPPAGPPDPPAPAPGRPDPATRVRVQRTGGVAGLRRERTLRIGELPADDAAGWGELLQGGGLRELGAAPPGRTHPDGFSYHVAWPEAGLEVTLAEHGIPASVRELLQRTLEA